MTDTSDHGALLKMALREIKSLKAALAEANAAKHEPIAVIGMACRFPGGANDPEAFWRLLKSGTDAITEVPASRWDVGELYDADPDAPGKMYTRWGGFLDDIDRFDAQFFGVTPLDAMNIDPQQRLLLEVAWEALENAGQVPEKVARTGVYIGSFMDDYLQQNLYAGGRREIDAYNTLGLLRSLAAGRLSYLLNLQGPAMQLDTACSSSLLAAHLAVQALRNRECDLALAGGVNLILAPEVTIGLCRMKAMAADGRCKSFDARADGYVRGEGCGIVILKRLGDALADGDRIDAVIRGSAVNHDGRSNGLTAPNGTAQKTLMRDALADAGVEPHQIQFIEAHGTGTSLGDPIEAIAAGEVLCEQREDPLLLGSVKSNFGHLESAAGVAALMKAALALKHAAVPPSLHFESPNPHIPWSRLPLSVPTELTPIAEHALAGVSSFGMSGTNVHMILEAPPRVAAPAAEGFHVLTLSAATPEALQTLKDRYVGFLESTEATAADICRTSNRGRKHFEHRIAVVGDSPKALAEKLTSSPSAGRIAGGTQKQKQKQRRARVAFLFPGQGTQIEAMREAFYAAEPVFRAAIDRCRPTAGIQSSLFAFEYAMAQLWMSWGIAPSAVIGHSVGEYAAACIAGVFTPEDALKLLAERERLMDALPERGTMAAIFCAEERVRAAVASNEVAIAALNGSHVVISGPRGEVEAVVARFRAEGADARLLQVAHAFHSRLMDPMLDDFENVASRIPFHAPAIPFVSTVTGRTAVTDLAHASYWREHIRRPVLFAEALRNLPGEIFIEIGPGATLTGMAAQIVTTGATMLTSAGPQRMRESLAKLYELGIDVDWNAAAPKGATVALPAYPFQRRRYWVAPRKGRQESANRRIDVPFTEDTYYESVLSADSPRYLRDHQLGDAIVVPAATYLSMALEATDAATLRDVTFPEMLSFPPDATKTLHSVVSPAGSFRFATHEERWTIHCSGAFDRTPLPAPPPVAVDKRQNEDGGSNAGFNLGQSFRWTRSVTTTEREAVCRLESPLPAAVVREYRLHPGLIDSCLRTLALSLKGDDVFVPFRIAELRVHRTPDPAATLWCRAVTTDLTGSSVTGDITLVDGSDEVVLEILGFEARKMATPWTHDALWQLEWSPAVVAQQTPDIVYECNTPAAIDDLLEIVQSFDRGASISSVTVVTRNAQAVRASDRVDPTYAWAWGFGRAVRLEHPRLRWRTIDLDDRSPLVNVNVDEAAIRDGIVYTPSLVQTTIVPDDRPLFRPDAAYLITGAFGGLGRLVAEWAAEQGARHLILAGRNPVDSVWRRQSCRRSLVKADIADRDAVNAIFEAHPDIKGVLHVAGVLDDALLRDLTPAHFDRVFAPKVTGTLNLHEATADRDLDFFVCFSSAASLLGSRGQANYAAANSFVDALAHHRRGRGLPALAINWGPWAESGMAARMDDRDRERLGSVPIPTKAGLEILGRLMRSDATQVGVFRQTQPAAQQQPADRLMIQLERMPLDARRGKLESHIRELIVSVMGKDPFQSESGEESFFELGMDSLMSLDLRNRLQDALDRTLPSTIAFEYPTVPELVEYLIAEV